MDPIDSMNAGSASPIDPNPNSAGPVGQTGSGNANPLGPNGPVGPGNPMDYNSSSPGGGGLNMTRIYQIALGILILIILILIIFVFLYKGKANKTQKYIDNVTAQAVDNKSKEDKSSCDKQIKDMKENPWAEYKALDEYGAFKFQVPKDWSQYEHYDMSGSYPYRLYFNPAPVHYDASNSVHDDHAALEVIISKQQYNDEVKQLESQLAYAADKHTEDDISISNFKGKNFFYKDKDLGKNVGVIILPYRDRALFIKTDDYDQWHDYFSQFYQSFKLTP